MRRVRGELSLHSEASLQSVECAVHGSDQREDFSREILFRETDRQRAWLDRSRLRRDLAQRFKTATDREDAYNEGRADEQRDDPRDVDG